MNVFREISPALNVTADEYFLLLNPIAKEIVYKIREEKRLGIRPKPSTSLVDFSSKLTKEKRKAILDKTADLVDENLSGRSDMCMQYALLVAMALNYLNLPAKSIIGTARYFDIKANEIFRWNHAWVRIEDDVIDANVDCLAENPIVPKSVKVCPYWGPIKQTPCDRKLVENHGEKLIPDEDIEKIWWPDLKMWLDNTNGI